MPTANLLVRISDAVKRQAKCALSEDMLLVYYAGHGVSGGSRRKQASLYSWRAITRPWLKFSSTALNLSILMEVFGTKPRVISGNDIRLLLFGVAERKIPCWTKIP
jgi:hypothetical protein